MHIFSTVNCFHLLLHGRLPYFPTSLQLHAIPAFLHSVLDDDFVVIYFRPGVALVPASSAIPVHFIHTE